MTDVPHPGLSIDRIIETFQFLHDWEQRYEFLIELGTKLPPMTEADYNESNRVQGCVSKAWLGAYQADEASGTLVFFGDSDASTVKGLVAVLVAMYSGKTPTQVQKIDADQVFEKLGLFDHLSPTRHVGVYAMVEKIKQHARSFKRFPTNTESELSKPHVQA